MSLASIRSTFGVLTEKHYLGPTKAALFAWKTEHGVMVFSNPRTRHLPQDWLELTRWCLTGGPNSGSQQWAGFVTFGRLTLKTTTVVSYSDESQGHTGALYRACGWLWAPTWLRLRPPPTGNGAWTEGDRQSVKDRWIFTLRPDERREGLLAIQDETIVRNMPWAQYKEPTWKRNIPHGGGGDFKRWMSERK